MDFKFKIHYRRRDSKWTYSIKKNKDGWYITHRAHNGQCTPDGNPYFINNFSQDSINYPHHFGIYLASLWDELEEGIIENDEAQEKMQALADWVSICDLNTPDEYRTPNASLYIPNLNKHKLEDYK